MGDVLVGLRRLGNRLLANRNYEGAKRAFQDLIRESPDADNGYVGLARTLVRLNDYQAIIELIEPIISTVHSTQLQRTLGDAYRVLANRGTSQFVDQAIKYYEAYHQRKDPVTLTISASFIASIREIVRARFPCIKRAGIEILEVAQPTSLYSLAWRN